MGTRSLQLTLLVLLGIAACVAVALTLYMAQPWGNNAYRGLSSYLVLGGFVLFGLSPYAGLAALSCLFLRSTVALAVFAFGAVCIGVGGAFGYFDSALVHVDPQSALMLLVMPLAQWVASILLVVTGIAAAWLWPGTALPRSHGPGDPNPLG